MTGNSVGIREGSQQGPTTHRIVVTFPHSTTVEQLTALGIPCLASNITTVRSWRSFHSKCPCH